MPSSLPFRVLATTCTCLLLSSFVGAQAPGTPPRTGRAGGFGGRGSANELRPYKEVVTAEAKTQPGVFKVHRIGDRILWEIPANLLGRLFLWSARVAAVPEANGFPGLDSTVEVKFTRHDNTIFVIEPDFGLRSGSPDMQQSVSEADPEPIVAAIPIEAEGPDKSMVIDVTGYFVSDGGIVPIGPEIGAASPDPSRSYLLQVNAFPNNIETRSVLTFVGSGGGFPGLRAFEAPQPMTVTVHWSLNLLAETPMMGRYGDSRVGFFEDWYEFYGGPKNREEDKQYISRFRLEKKDPTKDVSDPVKPIVFYIGRDVPAKWRPGIRKGILAWVPVFAQAGFSNAIQCKDAPSEKEDPTWNEEDSRYNVIRWAASTVENAQGSHVLDPRSGEILCTQVTIWNDILALVEDWYFAEAGACDPRCKSLPLPDDLMNQLITYVVTHEVGHTFGLRHNFKAPSAYTVADLRDPYFTRKNGLAASVMSYARFNYVAQPGDGAALIGGVGPYDYFAINWGYRPVPGAKTPDDEKSTLDIWAAKQLTDRHLLYADDFHDALGYDPSTSTENLTNDPVEATRLGFENIKRIAKLLPTASEPYGEDFSDLEDRYIALLSQRTEELGQVLRLVGGVVETDYHAGRGATDYVQTPAARQHAAVEFMLDNGQLPKEMLDPNIVGRFLPYGNVRLATELDGGILSALLADTRVGRLVDDEAANGAKAYTPTDLLNDVTRSVWRELDEPKPVIDLYRRVEQRAYVTTMDDKVNGPPNSEMPSLALEAVKVLAGRIDKALARTSDPETFAHLAEVRRQIGLIVDGKSAAAGMSSLEHMIMNGMEGADIKDDECWADPLHDAFKQFLSKP